MAPVSPGPTMATEHEMLGVGGPVVGLDEVGRGAVAGPVVVGAVVIDGSKVPPSRLNDSKKLTATVRRTLLGEIDEWAQDWSVGEASAAEIDEWGMSIALAVAGWRAVASLEVEPRSVLLDGPHDFLHPTWRLGQLPVELESSQSWRPFTRCVVRGDQTCVTIAAASIVAKVHRDAIMERLSVDEPEFGWDSNKGYLTAAHDAALRARGQSRWHRHSWSIPGRTVDETRSA